MVLRNSNKSYQRHMCFLSNSLLVALHLCHFIYHHLLLSSSRFSIWFHVVGHNSPASGLSCFELPSQNLFDCILQQSCPLNNVTHIIVIHEQVAVHLIQQLIAIEMINSYNLFLAFYFSLVHGVRRSASVPIQSLCVYSEFLHARNCIQYFYDMSNITHTYFTGKLD